MKGFRTVAFNALMTLVGLFGAEISPELAEQAVGAFVLLWGVGNVLLRAITNSPIFKPKHGGGGGP